MKRMWSAVVGGSLALTGCATVPGEAGRDTSNPITAAPAVGRCHMGGCGWFDIRAFEVVRETELGALIRVDMRDGQSSHPGDRDAPTSARGVKIDWGPYNRDTYLFCSTRNPAMIVRATNGSFEGYWIDLLMPAGVSEYITSQYVHVCHPDGALANNRVEAARRLGYRALGDQPVEFELGTPEQMFERVSD